jgi:hypothetical protein
MNAYDGAVAVDLWLAFPNTMFTTAGWACSCEPGSQKALTTSGRLQPRVVSPCMFERKKADLAPSDATRAQHSLRERGSQVP